MRELVERIRALSIKGRCFNEKTTFHFFGKPEDRIALVYGKNGSGKSTISEGFENLISNEDDVASELEVSLLDENNNEIAVTENDNIFVFNEMFIDNNVKIDDDGLGTIILLGSQVDLQTKIETASKARDDAKIEYEQSEANYNSYCDKSNPISPDYHLEKIKSVLKKGWAAKDAIIKGNKHNSAVTDKLVEEIGTLDVKETAAQIQDAISEKKSLLTKISDNITNYPNPVKTIPIQPGFEAQLCKLLEKKIDNPELTDREKRILSIIENGHQKFIESAQSVFAKDKTSYCPCCFQPVSSEYKKQLLSEISIVLNKEVEIHKAELSNTSLPDFSQYDYSEFETLDSEFYIKIRDSIEKCVTILSQYTKFITQKLENIYTPVVISALGLEESIVSLNNLLRDLEEKRKTFNDAANKKKDLKNDLILLNKKAAHLEIKPLYSSYKKQLQAKTKAESIRDNKSKTYESAKNILSELEQQKSNVNLAIQQINNSLRYIFFSDARLSIELKDNKYYLKSNGNNVKPKDISLGERNIIALCYFFTQILSNQDIKKLYQTEELIVIDDPVSSFDFENKVGIITYLRYQINRIMRGNSNSKIVIFSHDIETIFHLQKTCKDLCEPMKGIAGLSKPSFTTSEIKNMSLTLFRKDRNEYVSLLNEVFDFANGNKDDQSNTIGNSMRRVLETFSTFNYQKSIEKVFHTPYVLTALGDKSQYFDNLMCRLVLHGESHFEERVDAIQDGANFFQYVSSSEKRRTAKDILCFILILNEPHISICIDDKSKITVIKNWKNAIPDNSSFEISEPEINGHIIKLYDLPLSAGTGDPIFGESESTEYTTNNPKADFALKISGDSMEPTIPNGSIVLVQKCETLEDSKIGAFFLNGDVYCKMLKYIDGKTYLCSVNEKYENKEINPESDRLEVYGKVIDVISK